MQVVDRDLVLGADRDDLLREHVERVARDRASPRSRPRASPSRRRRDSSRSARNFGKMRPFETAPRSWPGPADALQAAGDRLRALDLDHEVDRAHVDPELERRRGDEARESAPPSAAPRSRRAARARASRGGRARSSRSASSLSRSASRSASRRLLTKTIVERCCSDELEQRRVDRRPDRAGRRPRSPRPSRRRPAARAGSRRGSDPGSRMSSTGDDHLEVELLARARVDELDRPAAGDEAPDLLERPLRRREADALERLVGRAASSRSSESARWAPRFVPATAWTSSTITVSTPRSISRPCEVRSRKSDSGVVIRMSGGVRSIWRRSRWACRPCARRPSASSRARRAARAGCARRRS